jgi:hypothetical protein
VTRARSILALGIGLLLAGSGAAPFIAPPPQGTTGGYKIIVRGSYEGKGIAAVGANSVTVNVELKNTKTGATGRLIAPNLKMSDGRFTGKGNLGALTVTVSGRVDAPDGSIVTKARIMGSFEVSDGLHGKFAGEHNGS